MTQAESCCLRPVRSALLLVSAVLAPVAYAQAPGEARPIVVDGQPLPAEAARERANAFIQGTGVASGNTPAARWVDPVCPRVLGLQAEGARRAEARIRAIAEQAGARVAPEPCDSNIVVTFAPDAGAVVREIDRRAPTRLAQLTPGQREELLTGSAPIRWWYSAETRTRHGNSARQIAENSSQATPATHDGSGAGNAIGGETPTVVHYNSSVISTLTQRALVSAGVVIDQDAVLGRRLDDIAAYAALVALAEIRSSTFTQDGSILGLFGDANPPRGLTPQDQAFLRALYAMPLDREARRHRSHLVGEMVAAVAAGGTVRPD